MAEPDAHLQGEILQTVTESQYAAISGTGDSTITIINLFGGSFSSEPIASRARAGLASDDQRPCPYRGLFPFGQNHAALFFGREAAADRLRQALRHRTILPLLGASGSGKSSLVFAGLVPRLHREGHWQYSYFRPGKEPFKELSRALLPLYAPSLNKTERLMQTGQLASALLSKEITLTDVLAEIRHNAPHERLLLIGDQFEELYSLCPDEEVRQTFLDVLFQGFAADGLVCSEGSTVSAGAFRLLLTMRADFLSNALAHRSFAALFQQEGEGKDDVKLGPMSEEELREVIQKPAASQGVAFESGLVERILKELSTEPGHLPLLEFALTELWRRRQGALITHNAYTGIGGVEGALARHADKSYAELDELRQIEARHIFLQLVRPGEGTEDTRRLASRQELGEARWAVVQTLADTRLVVTNRRQATGNISALDTVEVVHEALIRHWEKLQEWLSDDREFRTWQERLRSDLSRWEESKREDSLLLRGANLAQGKEWLQKRAEDLAPVEQDYITASADANERASRAELRQRRIRLAGLVIALAAVTIAFLIAWGQLVRAQHQHGEALAATARLTVTSRPADALSEALASTGFSNYGSLHPASQGLLSASSVEAMIDGLRLNHETNRLLGHKGEVRSATFSEDGRRIVSAGEDGTVRLWNPQSGQQIGQPLRGHSGWVRSAEFSLDGKKVVSAGKDGTIRIWSLTNKPEYEFVLTGHKGGVLSASFSPDGSRIVSAGEDETVRVWDAKSGKEIVQLLGHKKWVRSASFSHDGKLISSAGEDGTIRIWDAETGLLSIKPINAHRGWVKTAMFSHDGERIVSAGYDGLVKIWSSRTGRAIGRPLRGHEGWVKTAAFSSDDKKIVSAGEDGTIRIWDAKTGMPIAKPLTGHQGWVLSAAFSVDGRFIVSAGQDGSVRIWNVKTLETRDDVLRGHQGAVRSTLFSPDEQLILSTGDDGTIRLWNANNGSIIGEPLKGHEGSVRAASFSRDGKMIVSAGEDGSIRIWDVDTRRSIGDPFLGHQAGVSSAEFSEDGKLIVSAGEDGSVRRWDVSNGQQVGEPLLGHKGAVLSASFSKDSVYIVSSGQDGTLRLWDTHTGNAAGQPLNGHNEWARTATFSKDGKLILSAGDDGTLRLWSVQSGKPLGEPLKGHSGGIMSAAFSVESKKLMILSAGYDGTIRLWDAQSGKLIGEPLRGHQGSVLTAAFDTSGNRIVSGGQDGTVRIWDPKWTNPMRLVCGDLQGHQILHDPVNEVQREARKSCKRFQKQYS